MRFLYLDASAWVKRYYREHGSEQVSRLFSNGDARVCSVLGLVEVVATLARKCKANEISRQSFDAKAAEIDRDWKHFVKIELTLNDLNQARDAAVQFALRGADAVHFAAFRSFQQRLANSGHDVILVASDQELCEAATVAGYAVLVPENSPVLDESLPT